MKNINNNVQNLSHYELISINGGDGITEAVFYALGWINSVGSALFQDRPQSKLAAGRPFE